MTIAELNDKLCKDLVYGAFERQDRKFIATRFTYPVGDSVNLYLTGDEGHEKLTDLGTTHYFLKSASVDMDTDPRMEFVKAICAGFDIEVEADFVLSKPITAVTANDDVLNFCQAITRISALHYDQRAKQYQTFPVEVEKFIRKIAPLDAFYKQWTEPTIDPQANFPVDYHFNGKGKPRNIFVVGGPLSAERAVGTMNFFRANQRLDESMTVVAPDLGLSRRLEKKLELTSRVVYGTDEKPISKFILER